jgi:hypothetical protein
LLWHTISRRCPYAYARSLILLAVVQANDVQAVTNTALLGGEFSVIFQQ